MKKLFTNLTFWVLTAIAAGVILGTVSPENAIKMEPLGKYFIKIVTVFIYPIIFLTITLGISSMANLKKQERLVVKQLFILKLLLRSLW